jgi:integrase
MDVSIEQYDRMQRSVRDRYLVKTKRVIHDGFKRITDLIEDLTGKEGFSFNGLAKRLQKGATDSVFSAFDNRIALLKDNGRIGTASWYECALASIKKFANRDLKFSDLTVGWLEKYEAHLLKEGKAFCTVSINMRAIRAICNDAKARGIISESQYPFSVNNNGKYAIPEGTGQKTALNTSQLLAVFNYPIPPEWEKWRDLFIFSFYANGANLGDVLRLKYENIVGNYIEWYRGKTISRDKKKIKVRAAITEEMRHILHKYSNPDSSDSYVFNYLRAGLSPTQERAVIQNVTHNINKKLHKIGNALGINNLTSYVARHSWASISRHEGVSLYGISKGMGHKNLTTTQLYLDSLSDEEINENAAKLPRWHKV